MAPGMYMASAAMPHITSHHKYLSQRLIRPSKSFIILSSESSRIGCNQSRQFSRVPDYLVPQAYRERKLGQTKRKESYEQLLHDRGTSQNARSLLRKRRNEERANKVSTSTHRNDKQKKASSFRRQSLPKSRAVVDEGGNGLLDSEAMRQLENSLSLKMSDYITRWGRFPSLDDSAETGDSYNEVESALADYLPRHYLDERHADAAERSYQIIATDYRALIIGWSEIAESICADKTLADRKDIKGDGSLAKSDILLSTYEDAVLRAQSHLESFEALYRNHEISTRGNSRLEESNIKSTDTHHRNTLGKFSSFFEGFFSNNNRPTTSAFDQSWKYAGITNSSDCGDTNETPKKIKDFDQNTSLYEHVLLANHSSYCFGNGAKTASTQRSNRLLNRWISLHCLAQSNYSSTINCGKNSASKRKLFHTVVRANVDMGTVDGVKRAEEWLRRMASLQKLGRDICGPDVDTYNLVLLGFCNLCNLLHQSRSDRARRDERQQEDVLTRKFIVDGAERVLLELTESKDKGSMPNIMTLNLALKAIAKAGSNSPRATCQRANSLILKTIGEKKYRSIFVLEPSYKSNISMPRVHQIEESEKQHQDVNVIDLNLDTYHWLVDIYSASGNSTHIKQGMTLLRRMTLIRTTQTSIDLGNSPASFAPSTGTHNKLLRALMEKGKRAGNDAMFDADRTKTAEKATEFLGSMVKHGSSFPNAVSFLSILQMWQKTGSPDAGDSAEEILSRMEIVGIYQNELKHISIAYLVALQCWLTAAKAGRSGAAERAFRLLKMYEVRNRLNRSFCGSTVDESPESFETCDLSDRSISNNTAQMYLLTLEICAATHEKQDMSRVMAISFEIYDKMIHGRIKPNTSTFEMLYVCAKKFLDHHPEEEKHSTLQKVFDLASKHGITRGELIGKHKDSLRKYYLQKVINPQGGASKINLQPIK